MPASSWFICPPRKTGKIRLYCFSHAGGNALSFVPWQAALDPAIQIYAVQLPGRGAHLGQVPPGSFDQLVAQIVAQISGHDVMPHAFFGHSMGALLAFEVARSLSAGGAPAPGHIIASGCRAPPYRNELRALHELDDEALIEVLKDYNGTPPALLKMRNLMAQALPALRADFALVADYKFHPQPKLAMPFTVLAGKNDALTLPHQIEEWAQQTCGTCDVHWLDGDHFFIHSRRDAVLKLVQQAVLSILAR